MSAHRPTLSTGWPLLLAALATSTLRANDVLDQHTSNGGFSTQVVGDLYPYVAQSFVPSDLASGLTRVDLWLARDGTPPSQPTLWLCKEDSSNIIVGVPIDVSRISATDKGDWYSVIFPAGTVVTPGATYWLVLHATGYTTLSHDVRWSYADRKSGEDAYPNGKAYLAWQATPAWPPTGNWTAATAGDLAFRTYYDDGWKSAAMHTSVSVAPDPIKYPNATTVTVTVTGDGADVPGGQLLLSASLAGGQFEGGGGGPVWLDMAGGPATIHWTPPAFAGTNKTCTFTANYCGYQATNTKTNYGQSQGQQNVTTSALQGPSITSLISSLDDRPGDDIGVFIGGLNGKVAVNNTFTVNADDPDGRINRVEFWIDGILQTTAHTVPCSYTHDMSTLGTGSPISRLRVVVGDDNYTVVAEATRNILTIGPPPWLANDAKHQYVLDPQVTWDGAAHQYTFTCRIPNNPALYLEKTIHVDYLGDLQNIFESDIQVVETFSTSGSWAYAIGGVLNATVLGIPLAEETLAASSYDRQTPIDPPYARDLFQAKWSQEFQLLDETKTVYEGEIASFNVLGIEFTVNLTVDFGFNAWITISPTLDNELRPSSIEVTPSLSPYVTIDVSLDILFGVATLGVEATPTFTFKLPVLYVWNYGEASGHLDWDHPCTEFVLKAQFYVDLLWGAGHWESDEYEYGHTDWPDGCSSGGSGPPPRLGPASNSRLKLFQAPALAFDANGNGLAVWIHDHDPSPDREDPEVYYAVFQAGMWQPPQPLTHDQWWQTDPRVAFFGNNQAIVVWSQNSLTEAQSQGKTLPQILQGQSLWYSVWNAGVWFPPAVLPVAVAGHPSHGRVALAGDQVNGKVIAVWVCDADGDPTTKNDWDIYQAVYTAGVGWAPGTRLGPANNSLDAEPDVAFAANGTATCAWVRDTLSDPTSNVDRGVMYSRWVNGVWSAPATIPSPNGFLPIRGALWPSVTHDAGSQPVVIFTCRGQDPSGRDIGEGFKDRLWLARLIGANWSVWPSGHTNEGRIAARWPVAKLRPDNFVQIVYRTDDETGLNGFDGDLGVAALDVRTTIGDDSPGVVPNNDDVLDWQINMDVDSTGNVQVLWVREGSDHAGATFGDGYDDLMLMVLPTGMPNLTISSSDVTLSDPYPAPGADTIVTAKIRNVNTKEVAMSFHVSFYRDAVNPDYLLGMQTITSLGPNADTTVSLHFSAPAGHHEILVVADAANVIPETNEEDNTASAMLWLQVPPAGLAATPDQVSGGIMLVWQASPMPQVSSYRIYRSLVSGSGYSLISQRPGVETHFLDHTAQPNQTYYYVASALDPFGGEGGYSNEASANVGPDTDGDGIPDIADPDADNDGMPNTWEVLYQLNPLDSSDAGQDPDGDGLSNLQEYLDGTNPRDPNSHRDLTPPAPPVVTDDGTYSASPNSLHASWSAQDAESGIAEYEYAIGTTPCGTDLADWTSAGTATEVTTTGLALIDGQIYYVSVKARNGAGLWSDAGGSDGIIVDSTPPGPPEVADGLGIDLDCQRDASTLSAHWSSADPHSGITHFWYAVGIAGDPDAVQGWTDAGTATSVTLTGLALADRTTYYVRVWVENGAGLSSAITVSDGVLVQTVRNPADFNDDCLVDLQDYVEFQRCAAGPGVTPPENCEAADLDHDADVDQSDFGLFQRCYSGADKLADPNCAN